jgi:tartrate dehydrogenase/decarboxylase/D-malate dehydrogenase
MPDDALDILRVFDAIYFGAVGLPDVDDTLPANLLTFKIRTGFDQYVNYRPARLLPGVEGPLRGKSPKDIDLVVVRENTEGEFVQSGGFIRPQFPEGMATDTSIFTRKGIERIAHYSFQLAGRRRKQLTNVTKSNTLIHSLTYWDRIVEEVRESYPDVEYQKMYVDNASANFVLHPEQFDVVLTTNFIGDILSDLGGAIMGSLGLGPSGNINPEKSYPSMFEPIHGSAPDIAGQEIANPIGSIWSGSLMLEHLGKAEAAENIVRAIEATIKQQVLPVDLGGSAKTMEIAEAVISNL